MAGRETRRRDVITETCAEGTSAPVVLAGEQPFDVGWGGTWARLGVDESHVYWSAPSGDGASVSVRRVPKAP